jgi:hypothetical protein
MYLVEGNGLSLSFETQEEANARAKELASLHKRHRFSVSHATKDIIGLTDHHYKWDDYFKAAVQYCHND